RARLGELIEGVPDRDRIEPPAPVEGDQVAIVHRQAERTSKVVHGGVHVDSFDGEAFVARGAQKRADVAPDLESGSAASDRSAKPRRLRAYRAQLRVVKCAQQIGRDVVARVDLRQLVRPFHRIAVDETALSAANDLEGGTLGEGHAIEQAAGRCSGSNPSLVEGPQLL